MVSSCVKRKTIKGTFRGDGQRRRGSRSLANHVLSQHYSLKLSDGWAARIASDTSTWKKFVDWTISQHVSSSSLLESNFLWITKCVFVVSIHAWLFYCFAYVYGTFLDDVQRRCGTTLFDQSQESGFLLFSNSESRSRKQTLWLVAAIRNPFPAIGGACSSSRKVS